MISIKFLEFWKVANKILWKGNDFAKSTTKSYENELILQIALQNPMRTIDFASNTIKSYQKSIDFANSITQSYEKVLILLISLQIPMNK